MDKISTIRDLWNWAVENNAEDCRLAIPDNTWNPREDSDTMVFGNPLAVQHITDEEEYFCSTEGKPYVRLIPR